jgi:hypothetical protein
MSTKIGAIVEEGILNALNLSSGVSTRNIGLLMERVRGVPNLPVIISDIVADRKIFGGNDSNMYSPYVVKNFFDNLSGYGATVYGVRIVGADCVAAEIIVKNMYADDQSLEATVTQAATPYLEQITRIVPENVTIGDVFTVEIKEDEEDPHSEDNTVSYTALSASTTEVIAALAALIQDKIDSEGNLFSELLSAVETDSTAIIITGIDVGITFFTLTTATNNPVSDDIFTLKAGRMGQEDVGTWGNDLSVRVFPIGHANGLPSKYLLEIYYQNILVESFSDTTWELLQGQINARSEYVLMEEIDYDVQLTLDIFTADFAGGEYNSPVEADFEPEYDAVTGDPEGLAIFDGVDAQILACPEVFSSDFAIKADNFCRENKKYFVYNLPNLATETVITSHYTELVTGDRSYISSYLNWAEVDDDLGGKIWIPAIGYILAAGYVRQAAFFGSKSWIPPAGVETRAYGIYRFTHDTLTDVTIGRYVKSYYCNVIKYVRNVGWCIWSSRTYSSNSLFNSVHISLETNWLIESLLLRNTRFTQKLNTTALRNEIKIDNIAFFKNLYNEGGIENSVKFEDAVQIVVTTNTEDRKELDMVIAWIPPECTELLKIKLSRNDGILYASFV